MGEDIKAVQAPRTTRWVQLSQGLKQRFLEPALRQAVRGGGSSKTFTQPARLKTRTGWKRGIAATRRARISVARAGKQQGCAPAHLAAARLRKLRRMITPLTPKLATAPKARASISCGLRWSKSPKKAASAKTMPRMFSHAGDREDCT